MDTNEEDKDLDLEDEEEDTEEGDKPEDGVDDEGKKKPKENGKKRTPEEQLEYFEGRAARIRKQLGKTDADKKEAKTEPTKPAEGLDYGQKAFLATNGVKGAGEFKIIETAMKQGGLTLEQAIESPYVQGMLKDERERVAAKEAIPSTKKTGGADANGPKSVEYWLKKGELPPDTAENTELRRKVVNAKMKTGKGSGHFHNSK